MKRTARVEERPGARKASHRAFNPEQCQSGQIKNSKRRQLVMKQEISPELIRGLLTGAISGESKLNTNLDETEAAKFPMAAISWPEPARREASRANSNSNVEPVAVTAMPALPRVEAAPQKLDFIQGYSQYADIIECDRLAHFAVGIAIVSALLNRQVQIVHGGLETSLDLWVLLLSKSGMGRNTLLKSARRILKIAGLEQLVHKTGWGSSQAVHQQIAENPCGLFIWPEMSVVLKLMADSRFGGIKEWLTNCYDEFAIPDCIRYRKTGKASDTPDIEFTQAPRLNIIASSSYAWFVQNLSEEDATGGFIPRWTIVSVPESGKSISKPESFNKKAECVLSQRLSKIADLKGEADLSQVEGLYDTWYRETRARFRSKGDLADPFFNRLRAQVLKFAVVFEASANASLRVSEPAMSTAIRFAARLEDTISELLPTAMSREGAGVEKIGNYIKAAGPDGVLRSALTREFQHLKYYEREGRLRTLRDGGEVISLFRKGAGRSAEILVHKNFAQEHEQAYPDDRRG